MANIFESLIDSLDFMFFEASPKANPAELALMQANSANNTLIYKSQEDNDISSLTSSSLRNQLVPSAIQIANVLWLHDIIEEKKSERQVRGAINEESSENKENAKISLIQKIKVSDFTVWDKSMSYLIGSSD